MNPQEQLNEATEKYKKEVEKKFLLPYRSFIIAMDSFKAGATSPSAANGCNKWVEIEKIKAKIDYSMRLKSGINAVLDEELNKLQREWGIIEQQLENLKQQQ